MAAQFVRLLVHKVYFLLQQVCEQQPPKQHIMQLLWVTVLQQHLKMQWQWGLSSAARTGTVNATVLGANSVAEANSVNATVVGQFSAAGKDSVNATVVGSRSYVRPNTNDGTALGHYAGVDNSTTNGTSVVLALGLAKM